MKIVLSKAEFMKVISDGLKHKTTNGVSFTDMKVISFRVDDSNWDSKFEITVEHDDSWK